MENKPTFLDDLYRYLKLSENKLVVSYIEERDKDYNGRKYPYKTKFTVTMLDTTDVDRMSKSPDVLKAWLGFELGVYLEPDGTFYKKRTVEIERFSGNDMELLIKLAESDRTDNSVALNGKYHTLLFQKKEDERTPLTCVTGDVPEIKSYIKQLVNKGQLLAYEVWSGAGENKMVKSFKVEKDYEVSGIPRYGESTVYDVAFVLDNAILTLEQAQRLVYFDRTQTTWRNVTWGTGYRVELRIVEQNEKPKMGLLWTINNPLD